MTVSHGKMLISRKILDIPCKMILKALSGLSTCAYRVSARPLIWAKDDGFAKRCLNATAEERVFLCPGELAPPGRNPRAVN